MLFLSKLFAVFLEPLGLAILLGVAALWTIKRAPRVARLIIGLSFLIMWVSSMPIFANWLSSKLELVYPPIAITRVPDADVAVVLGGIVGQPVPPRVEPDLGDPVDRIVEAWRLFRAGKVRSILVVGGNLPWGAATEPEAVLIKQFLLELGVPESAIAIETSSRNTYENAHNAAPILAANDWRSILLVTSGMHMPRAVATFTRSGIKVVPVPTDLHSHSQIAASVLDFLPDAQALAETSLAMKEVIGLLYYRLRGWA